MPLPTTPSSRASWATITPSRSWSSKRLPAEKAKSPVLVGRGFFVSVLELLAQLEDEHAAQGGERGRRARAGVGEGRVGVGDVVDGDARPGGAGPGELAVLVVADILVRHHYVAYRGLGALARGGIAGAVLDGEAPR